MAPVPIEPTPERPPLHAEALERALVVPGGLWSHVEVVTATGSTNADVADLARAGAAQGHVLVAESQLAGRGRLGRSWQAPERAGLTMSVLLRPYDIGAERLGWLPLMTGVAVVEACAETAAAVQVGLKWPNDLLVQPAGQGSGWGKCAGILAEVVAPDAVVVGVGINVSQVDGELPPPADPRAYPPTSLLAAGADVDRERLAIAVLERLSHWYDRWWRAAGDPIGSGLLDAYRARCLTLLREVSVQLPGGEPLHGTVTDVDVDGRIVVRTEGGDVRLAAGDVHHVR